MPALYCEICNPKKRMINQKIMDLHMAKTHKEVEEKNTEEATTISLDNKDEVVEPQDSLVTIKSADLRKLEVSINGQVWNGTEIHVPKSLETTIRRTLEQGGFYLKD